MGNRVDRIWVFGGVALIVLLTVLSWFVLISPKYTEAADVRTQVEDTETQLVALRKRIRELEKQAEQLPTFKAELKKAQDALPSDPDVGSADFLRQLQNAGDQVGIVVSGLTAAETVDSTAVPGVKEVPMTLTANGPADKLSRFLTQLQNIQPRAILVRSATLNQADATDDSPTLNLSVTGFTVPDTTSAPLVTTPTTK